MASTPNPHVKNLEASLRSALDRAVAARNKLSAARRQYGLSGGARAFLTAEEYRAEMREQRRQHDEELRGMAASFMGGAAKYRRVAQLMMANASREVTAEERAQRDWLATVAAAQEIVEERDRDAASKATARAIIRAGRRRRGED
ncbi:MULTISPECIES: hypothetical protein [unclassified Bradyrhizobium]|uniref:hypothetical protein n=1 Tax=unclassified Bradyrhizobium TaxID=2631580 RepID=UPI0028EB665C|nr:MULTISPECIES: hypothetical protein [unclassified Bradyrhizobium]